MTTPAAGALNTATEHPNYIKVVTAGCVGIFVELYDNGIFAFMATALAIVFFDVSSATDALLLVFAGYAISSSCARSGLSCAESSGTRSAARSCWSS